MRLIRPLAGIPPWAFLALSAAMNLHSIFLAIDVGPLLVIDQLQGLTCAFIGRTGQGYPCEFFAVIHGSCRVYKSHRITH